MAQRPYIVNWKMHGTRAMLSGRDRRAAERLLKAEVALALRSR
jgi:hypothetical protein